MIMIYPGPLGIPATVAPDAPPAFLLAANDDACCSEPIVKLLQAYREAKLPVEAHIFASGGHGFNMGYRSKLATLKSWPQRLTDWLTERGIAQPRE
jgi:dienelactone hydrolase